MAGYAPGPVDDVGYELYLGIPLEAGEGLVGSAELLGHVIPDLGGGEYVLRDLPIPDGDIEAPGEVYHVELADRGRIPVGDAPSGLFGVHGPIHKADVLDTCAVGHSSLLKVGVQIALLDPGLMDDDLGDLRQQSLDCGDVGELGRRRFLLEGHERFVLPHSGGDLLACEFIESAHLSHSFLTRKPRDSIALS